MIELRKNGEPIPVSEDAWAHLIEGARWMSEHLASVCADEPGNPGNARMTEIADELEALAEELDK